MTRALSVILLLALAYGRKLGLPFTLCGYSRMEPNNFKIKQILTVNK